MCYVTHFQCLAWASWGRNASAFLPLLQVRIWVLRSSRWLSWGHTTDKWGNKSWTQDTWCISLLLLLITWPSVQELRKVPEMSLFTRKKKRRKPRRGEREGWRICLLRTLLPTPPSTPPALPQVCWVVIPCTPGKKEVVCTEGRGECTAVPIFAVLPKDTFTSPFVLPFS